MTEEIAEVEHQEAGKIPPENRTIFEILFFSPQERRLRAGWRLALQALVLAVFVLGMQFIVRYYLYANNPSIGNYDYYISRFITLLGITGSVYVARVIIDDRSFPSLGLFLDAKAGRDFGVGLGISFLMAGLIFLAGWALGWVDFRDFAWNATLPQSFTLFWFVFLALFLTTAWQEELLFRGYWLKNIKDGLNVFWAVGISSVGFAAMYLLNPNYTIPGLVGLLILGLFYGYAAFSSKRLWLSLGLHLGWKLFQGNVFGFRVSGLQVPGIIIQQTQGPGLWTGGRFGPEAGLMLLPVLILGTFLVWLYTSSEG